MLPWGGEGGALGGKQVCRIAGSGDKLAAKESASQLGGAISDTGGLCLCHLYRRVSGKLEAFQAPFSFGRRAQTPAPAHAEVVPEAPDL